jgi:hypothetical protein
MSKPYAERYIVGAKVSAVKGGKVWEVFDLQTNRVIETWAHKASAVSLCGKLNREARAAKASGAA